MITREVGGGLLCFRQPDHARLAGRLAAHWGGEAPDLRPREPVLLAIANHDAGWEDVDRRPVFDPVTGRPHTYASHDLETALAIADRSTSLVSGLDPYAGWLVGRHFLSFHERSDRPGTRPWVEAQGRRLDVLLAEAGDRYEARDLEPRTRQANLDGLQLLDAVSLALCQAWPAWKGRPMATTGPCGKTRYCYATTRSDELRVEGSLEPWPFEATRLEDAVPARRLGARRWDDEGALQRAWISTPELEMRFVLSRAGGR